MLNRLIVFPAKRIFGLLASLKTAIPLLVLTIAITVVGSLFPTPDFFRTWWYLSLLGLNGVSLLFITILHVPMILERKGRNALIGVVVTHLGILILIVGAIYGALSGFRYEVKAIEGQMTVVPGLPFVVHLDRLELEDYPTEMVAHMTPTAVTRKRQDSHLSLYRNGELWLQTVISPGYPATVEGITILPALKDVGWYFELIVTDPLGRDKTIPVRPWAPPLVNLGSRKLMAHSLMGTGRRSVQVFTIEAEQMVPVGVISEDQPLLVDGYSISLGPYKRYTGLAIYNRPQAPILVAGCLAMLFGLLWHFYHRHRDRKKTKGDELHV